MSECCDYCGLHHMGACPRVKAIEYYENGTVKRVDLHTPKDERRSETQSRPKRYGFWDILAGKEWEGLAD